MTITNKQLIMGGLATFVMFMPRKLELFGVFSFRFVILLLAIVAFGVMRKPIRLSGMQRRPFYILYLVVLCIGYVLHMEIASMIGYMTDIFVLYLLLSVYLKSKDDLDFFVVTFVRVLSVYALLCVVETLTGVNIWALLGVPIGSTVRYGLHRCYGAFTVFSNNGLFLLLSFPMVWYVAETTSHKKLAKIANLLVWAALCGTLTRAMILLAVALNALVVWRAGILRFLRRNGVKIMVVLGIVAFAVVAIPRLNAAASSAAKMFIALVDPEVAAEISSDFGSNAKGVGERTNLYVWVWETIRGHEWLGMGPNALFNYEWVVPSSGKTAIKTSIENFYLATMYRFGITGLLSLLLFFAQELIVLLRHRRAEARNFHQKKPVFAFRELVTMILYMVGLLTVSAVDDYRMFFILIAVGDAYHRIMKNNAEQAAAAAESEDAGNKKVLSKV